MEVDDFMLADSQDDDDAIVSPAAKSTLKPPSIGASSTHISSSRQTTANSVQPSNPNPSLKITLKRPDPPRSAAQPAPAPAPPTVAATKAAEVMSLSDDDNPGLSPPPKPRPKARRLPKPTAKRTSDVARLSSDDEVDLLGQRAAPAEAQPEAGPSGSQAHSHSTNPTVPSSPLSTPPEPSPAVSKKQKKARTARAVSEDGDLSDVMRQVEEAQARQSEDDSDFDSGRAKKAKAKGKGKKAAKATKKAPVKGKKGKKGKAAVVEPAPEPELEAGAEAMEVDNEPGPVPVPVVVKAKNDRRLVVESDEEQQGDQTGVTEPAKSTPVVIKPTDPTTKARASATKLKEPSFTIEVPTSNKRLSQPRAVPVAKPTLPAKKGRGKQKAVVVDSEDDDPGAFDSEAESAILTGDDDSDAPPAKKKPAKAAKAAKGAKGAKGAKKSPVGARKAASPVASRTPTGERPRRLSAAEREAAMMKAAQEEVVDDLVTAPVTKSKGGTGGKKGAKAVDDDEEDADSEEGKDDDKDDEDQDGDKENAGPTKPAPPKPAFSTPSALSKSAALNRPRSATPGSAFATPRPAKGVGRILHKLSNSGLRAPGLSAKAKIPRLHANLKEAPKARPVVPQAKVKPKKGAKEYGSDEDVPWWETKPHEEWDSDDNRKYAIVLRKKERGWSSD